MTSSLFLNTINGQIYDKRPLWMMRQAGRYLAEYKAVRASEPDFISFCLNPEKACEVTLQPINRFAFDAAIIFSDILMVPWALERNVRFITGTGPKLDPLEPSDMVNTALLGEVQKRTAPVGTAIELTRAKLAKEIALIGFAGAPWTVITYMIEGGSSRDFALARQWMWSHPKAFEALLELVTDATVEFLAVQAKAGADALMLFDSWASAVPAHMRDAVVIKPARTIVERLRAQGFNQPIIGFPKGIGEGLIAYADASGVDAVAIDHMTDLLWAHKNLPKGMPIQGNLDPLSLISGGELMDGAIDAILDAIQDRPHIFNLGHGITPQTPVENVERMVARVRGL